MYGYFPIHELWAGVTNIVPSSPASIRSAWYGLAVEVELLLPTTVHSQRVAKPLLCFYTGGVEQLEKQLHLQDSEQDNKPAQVGSGFSRSLYDRVLSRNNNRGNSAFSGGSSTTPRYVQLFEAFEKNYNKNKFWSWKLLCKLIHEDEIQVQSFLTFRNLASHI